MEISVSFSSVNTSHGRRRRRGHVRGHVQEMDRRTDPSHCSLMPLVRLHKKTKYMSSGHRQDSLIVSSVAPVLIAP